MNAFLNPLIMYGNYSGVGQKQVYDDTLNYDSFVNRFQR